AEGCSLPPYLHQESTAFLGRPALCIRFVGLPEPLDQVEQGLTRSLGLELVDLETVALPSPFDRIGRQWGDFGDRVNAGEKVLAGGQRFEGSLEVGKRESNRALFRNESERVADASPVCIEEQLASFPGADTHTHPDCLRAVDEC